MESTFGGRNSLSTGGGTRCTAQRVADTLKGAKAAPTVGSSVSMATPSEMAQLAPEISRDSPFPILFSLPYMYMFMFMCM